MPFINNATFMECSSLSNIEISPNVVSINISAFENCISLNNIQIPKNVKTIGEKAFKNCANLKSIAVSPQTNIGKDAIDEYSGVTINSDDEIVINIEATGQKNTKYIPMSYVNNYLVKHNKLVDFIRNSDFKAFGSYFQDLEELLKNQTEEERFDFYKFAVSLGCFRTDRLLDKDRT